MSNQKEAKEWFYECFRLCYGHCNYNTFVDGKNGKNFNNCKQQKENSFQINCEQKYQPDVVLEDKNGRISFIIEIEGGDNTDYVKKGVPGAILLADYCVSKLQREKIIMLFIAFCENDVKSIEGLAKVARSYCLKSISEIKVCDFDCFKKDPIGELNKI